MHVGIKRESHGEYWLKGGRGSGKSSFISIELILGMLRNADANAIIYRKVAATLRESVYEQMIWAIDALGLNDYFRFKITPMEICYLPTGQRILFRGADDPGKSKSLKLSKGYFKYLWFEELAEFSGMDDVRTIKASVIRGGGAAHTFYSYNPPRSKNNWVNAEALMSRPDRMILHTSYMDVPREWLGESFIAEAEFLKSVNDRAYNHVYLGEPVGIGGQVFDNLKLRSISREEIQAMNSFYNGLDFGFAIDPDALIRVAYEPRLRKLLVIDEFYRVRATVDELAGAVKKMCGSEPVTCDSADPRMIQELRRRGISAYGAHKGPGSVEHGIRRIQELAEVAVDPVRCPNAAREFSGYEYDIDGNGNFRAGYPDKNNHLIDAMRYALEGKLGEKTAKTLNRDKLGF